MPWFLFFPPLHSSLANVEYKSVLLREGAELLVFDLGRLAEALVLVLPLWPLLLCLLEVDSEVLACRNGGTEVLVFDLADAAKALAQFEHSSEMLIFILDASQEATEQFEQATVVEEAFLIHCSRLLLDFLVLAFGYAGAATLPSNMVDVGSRQKVSSIVGDVTSFRVIPSRSL